MTQALADLDIYEGGGLAASRDFFCPPFDLERGFAAIDWQKWKFS